MAIIPLTKGYETVIDSEDYPLVSQYSWYAHVDKRDGKVYACRTQNGKKNVTVFLHKFILDSTKKPYIDHVDGNTLNNTRNNLRAASFVDNVANRLMNKNNTSGFKGVTKHGKRWRARIGINGVRTHIGFFDTAEDAAKAYDERALGLWGEFAKTNKTLGLI